MTSYLSSLPPFVFSFLTSSLRPLILPGNKITKQIRRRSQSLENFVSKGSRSGK